MTNQRFHPLFFKTLLISLAIAALSACGSSSDDDEDETGYIKFYNASPNSPDVFLTVDEDLDEDDDDEIEQTYSGIGYGEASRNIELPNRDYFIELAWQDEDSALRADLELVYEGQIDIDAEVITMIVLTESFPNPVATQFNIPVIDLDEEEDTDNDRFNLRFLNLHPDFSSVDIYMSKSDETFNEAVLMGTYSYLALSDNTKLDEDQYVFYITQAGSTEVLFESVEVSYPFSNQYVLAVRPNFGADDTPFVIDNIGTTSNQEYQSSNAKAQFRLFNGIEVSDLLPEYSGSVDIESKRPIDSEESSVTTTQNLLKGEFSPLYTIENGDYTFSVQSSGSDQFLLQNQLISLPENVQRTFFFYTSEEAVDEDGDGDIDENGDGIIDETEAVIKTMIVEMSSRNRLYDHEIELINLVDAEEFDAVSFYFVKSDENVETAENRRTVGLGSSSSLVLRNNTYEVYAIADIDGNATILKSQLLTLDEDSGEQFLIFQTDSSAPSGYTMQFINQIPE